MVVGNPAKEYKAGTGMQCVTHVYKGSPRVSCKTQNQSKSKTKRTAQPNQRNGGRGKRCGVNWVERCGMGEMVGVGRRSCIVVRWGFPCMSSHSWDSFSALSENCHHVCMHVSHKPAACLSPLSALSCLSVPPGIPLPHSTPCPPPTTV